MRHYNFAEDEPKDEKADESGDENEDVSFFLLDDADNSGEKSGDAANLAYAGSRVKRLQTFSIILPNLIHNSKKRDLKN